MAVQDTKLLPTSKVAEHLYNAPLTTAVSLTARPFNHFKPGYGFQLTRLGLDCRTKAGNAAINARIVRGGGVLSNPNVRKDAVAEKYQSDAFSYMIAGIAYSKALATAGVFTANNVIAIGKWGVLTFQINAAGTITTKAPALNMAYATEAEALRAVPAADASNIRIAMLTVHANVGATWTANTDDLTPASDCQAANFAQGPFNDLVVSPFPTNLAAVAGSYVEAVKSTNWENLTGDEDAIIVLTQTTDGTGALTDALATLGIRPFPLNGENPTYPTFG